MSLIFAWIALSGFRSTRTLIFALTALSGFQFGELFFSFFFFFFFFLAMTISILLELSTPEATVDTLFL